MADSDKVSDSSKSLYHTPTQRLHVCKRRQQNVAFNLSRVPASRHRCRHQVSILLLVVCVIEARLDRGQGTRGKCFPNRKKTKDALSRQQALLPPAETARSCLSVSLKVSSSSDIAIAVYTVQQQQREASIQDAVAAPSVHPQHCHWLGRQ